MRLERCFELLVIPFLVIYRCARVGELAVQKTKRLLLGSDQVVFLGNLGIQLGFLAAKKFEFLFSFEPFVAEPAQFEKSLEVRGLQFTDILFQDGEILPDGAARDGRALFYVLLLLERPVDLGPGLLLRGRLGIQKKGLLLQLLGRGI